MAKFPIFVSFASTRGESSYALRRRDLMGSALGLMGTGSLLSLTGCGGADEDTASLRFVNATVDYSAADFWVKGSKAISAVANGGAVSKWYLTDAESTQIELHAAASDTSKLTETRSLSKDTLTSVLAYGSLATSLKFKYFEESNGFPDSGNTKFRLFHGSPTLTALDLFVSNTSSLSDLTPTLTVSAYGELSAFVTMTSGTYRLRVTASGDKTNVLFDYTGGANLYSKSTITLVVVPRATGSLPNLTALPEQSTGDILVNSLAV